MEKVRLKDKTLAALVARLEAAEQAVEIETPGGRAVLVPGAVWAGIEATAELLLVPGLADCARDCLEAGEEDCCALEELDW